MNKMIIASLVTLAASTANAEQESAAKGLYVGGGISYNDLDAGSIFKEVDNDSASGFQLFAGLPIESSIKGFETFVELGYFQTNNLKIAPNVKEARIGVELGDDDGMLMGVGAGYRLSPKVELRAEFVNKDLITSYQANALVRF